MTDAKEIIEKLNKKLTLAEIVDRLRVAGHKTSISHISRIANVDTCERCGHQAGRKPSSDLVKALKKINGKQ